MPIEIVGVSTTRESDGLAMSSRNRYLSTDDRAVAPRIFAELQQTRAQIETGSRNFEALERAGFEALKSVGFKPDYYSIRDASNLLAPSPQSREVVILTAARIGRARLIDNVRATIATRR
jgi:pantoate--beta-alanine ligase